LSLNYDVLCDMSWSSVMVDMSWSSCIFDHDMSTMTLGMTCHGQVAF